MWQIALVVGLGLVGAAVASDKRRAAPKNDAKPAEPPKPEAKPLTADDHKAAGRAEALAEIKAERAAQRKLEQAVRRAMGNSPRARVAPPAGDDDDGIGDAH